MRIFLILEIVIMLTSASLRAQLSDSGSFRSLAAEKYWDLPRELVQVAGIAAVDAERLASVSSEMGKIFIYHIGRAAIELSIPFGPAGDYRGIALVNQDVYIAGGDGRIIEVLNFRAARPVVNEYRTHLAARHKLEGVCYDKRKNRLLVCVRDENGGTGATKPVYEFDLNTKTMAVKPAVKVDLTHPLFAKLATRGHGLALHLSDILIHPQTGDILITEARRAQLLQVSSEGKMKTIFALDKSAMVRPEGLCIGPSGELFIAGRGRRQAPAQLVQVRLD